MKATQYRLDWRAATLSSLLALVLSLAFLPLTALADDVYIEVTTPDVPVISSTTTIDTGGTYQLDAALTGADITINTSDPVTIIGNGGAIEAVGTNNNIAIIGWTNGVDLTLQDVAIIDNNYNKSVLNFTGGTNYLYFSGTNLLEIEQGGGGTQAMVHVPEAANLTVGGTGTLYFYKSSQGAGFGSDKGEKNGDMTFNNVTIFGKSTKPGPAIGSGAAYSGAPGNITFNSGEYTIIANAMGACIGGGSGGGGGTLANPGGNVYVKGGTLSINVDWAGAAIGGGGYAGGNDAIGGNLYVTGGSIRTVCDENALSNWASAGVTQYGVTDKVVTANKLDADGEPVRMLVFDTSLLEASASYFEVQIDGNDFYNGTLHHYKFINEEKNKDSGEYEPITVTSTNWVALEDSNLYFYISPAEHSLIVNGEEFTATWDAEADSFTVASAQSEQADPTDGLKAVYLNGASGNDANDGIEAATAVKTFSAAKALLSPTYAGATIYITGIVTVTADETWSLAGYNQARVQRASTFTGSSKYFITLNTANVTLTLEDIILDGGGQELACTSTSPLVYLRNGNLVINDGAVLQNNYSGNGGGVYVYGANASLYMNGGSIINNSATYGSAIYNYNSAAVEINGGILSAADGSADLIFVALSRPLSLGSVATTGNVNSIYVNNQPAANTIQVTAPLVGPFSYVPGGTTSTSNGRALFKGTDEYALTSADAEKVTIAVENRSLVLDAENNQLVVSAPTYDINIPVMEHGSISASPSPCTPGETVTLTVTPEVSEENGTYRLWEESLTVTAASGAELELTKSSSNYTFTMPNEAVNVSSATFKRVRNVTVASGIVGGTITTSANTRVEGDTVTITAVANSYWSIASLSYTAAGSDESVEIPLASLSGRTATFIMPDADLQISGTFSEQPYDVSWYNTTDTEFTLTSAAQLWGLSRIVNNKAEASEAGIVEGIDPSIPADDFQGKTVHLATDVDLGAVQISAGGYDDAGNWTEPSWSGTEWVPIGSYTSSGLHSTGSENGLYGRPFKGTFDGGYHRISNLYVPYYGTSDDSAEGNCHGLFGDLGQAGVVKNVVVTSGFIKGARFNGAIVGRNWGGVENCASYAFVQANGRAGAGGITGCNYNNGHLPYVLNCIAYGEIYNPKTTTSGTPSAGGITATNEGTLTNCLFVGKVGTGAATVNCGGLTTGTLTDRLINSWYRDGARVRAANLNDTAYAKAADEIKTAEFAAAMGEAYAYVEGDWPVLAGTLPEAEPEPEVDTSWYNSTDTSFTLYSASDLKGLAAIVNGTADGIAQDDFAGKTVSLGADIALAEDGLYTAATGIYGAGSYKMQATYYILDESAPIWTPIGSGVATDNSTFSSSNWFAGSFDGQGYTISGIYTDGSATVQGLFGNVSGSVSNLTVSGCVQGDFVVGAAVAHLAGGSVSNVTNNAVVFSDGGESPDSGLENGVSKAGATGGIVGSAEGTSEAPFAITGCTNNGDVTCANTAKGGRTGGILGIVDKTTFVGSISQNINNGHVESYQYAGGVVGANFSTAAPISQCVNHGKVMLNASGSGYAGGIVSQCYSPVSYCYNTGQYGGRLLSGDKVSHIGGIVSDLFSPATVSNCYNVGSFCREGTPVISTTSSTGKIVGSGGGKHSTTAANIFNSYFLLTGSAEKEYADADASLGGQGWLPLGAGMSASEMKTGEFALLLNGDEGADGLFRSDYAGEDAINGGYPVLAFEGGTTPVASGGIAQSGDLDGDGVVTAADALRAAQAVISGGGSLTAMQFAAADIDGDGYLTMADAIKIVRRAAGLG